MICLCVRQALECIRVHKEPRTTALFWGCLELTSPYIVFGADSRSSTGPVLSLFPGKKERLADSPPGDIWGT